MLPSAPARGAPVPRIADPMHGLDPSRRSLSTALLCAFLVSSCGRAPEPRESAPEAEQADAEPASAPAASAPRADPAARRQAERHEPGPRIAFDAPDFDFGKVSDIEPLKHTFAFRNAGDQRLVVTEAKASCGCTTTTLAKQAYEPGEEGTIEAVWEPQGFGSQKKTVTVTTNGRPERTMLSVSAQVEPFVAFDPIYLSFNQVQLGREHTLRAALRC